MMRIPRILPNTEEIRTVCSAGFFRNMSRRGQILTALCVLDIFITLLVFKFLTYQAASCWSVVFFKTLTSIIPLYEIEFKTQKDGFWSKFWFFGTIGQMSLNYVLIFLHHYYF